MAIVKLGGRLGNQLFQVAFGLSQSQRSSTPMRFDCTDLSVDQLEQLEAWTGQLERATFTEILRTQGGRGWSGKIWRLVQRSIPWSQRSWVLQTSAHFQPLALTPRRQAYFDGYWQSYRYWTGLEPLIRQWIRFRGQLSPSVEHLLHRIDSKPSLAVHVRRGDYLGSPGFPLLTATYYRNAVQAASATLSSPTVWIFSDDPRWCRENLHLGPAVEVVEGQSAEIDLFLMSRCSAHVIGPSTFGWWGAWLGQPLCVVVPELWFSSYSETPALHDIFPESWKILSVGTSETNK